MSYKFNKTGKYYSVASRELIRRGFLSVKEMKNVNKKIFCIYTTVVNLVDKNSSINNWSNIKSPSPTV